MKYKNIKLVLHGAKPPFSGKEIKLVDAGIRHETKILWENGIETFESCEGGKGHSFPEPTVRFAGDSTEGYKALAIALQHGLKVNELRRYWSVQNGELNGPYWEMSFVRKGR
jgi:hypothetical protein